ncbi:MAG: hypothetical protein ACW960_16455 [Candidatus Thorarchaeota archaeon]
MKWSDFAKYALAGILVVGLLLSVPYRRVEQRTNSYEATPQSWHNVSLVIGGPMITLVTVELNRTSTIRFMYPDGVWPKNVYNYLGTHYTIAIEVDSRGPIWIRVRYVYAQETESSILENPLDWLSPIILP